MAYTLQNVLDLARSNLLDNTIVSTGQLWPNNLLIPFVATPWRRMWSCMVGTSKRVQRTVYFNLPAFTTVVIPSTYGINDFSEPIWLEQRVPGPVISIISTDVNTPIRVKVANTAGLSSSGEAIVSGVAGTVAPWGLWYPTLIDATTFSLNGSASDGNAGTGGNVTLTSNYQWFGVNPVDDLPDGVPEQWITNYLWQDEKIQLTPSTVVLQIKLTYWSSGTAPTNPNEILSITNCPIDFLAAATAANAAYAQGWYQRAQILFTDAYGPEGQANGSGGMLGEFVKPQVLADQTVQRRRGPFRGKRPRFGAYYSG